MNAKSLRDSIVQELTGANTSVGSNVFSAKAVPTLLNNLPAIIVLVPTRTGNIVEHSAGGFIVSYTVEINVVVGQSGTYLDLMDEILDDIREALFGDASWWDDYMAIEEYTEDISLYNEGEKPIVIGTLRFQVDELENYQ